MNDNERIEYLVALGTPDDHEPGDNEYTGLDYSEAAELDALRTGLVVRPKGDDGMSS